MANRKANGEESIKKYFVKGVQKGWRATLMHGYDLNNKPIKKQFYGKTQREVKEKLDDFKVKMADNELTVDEKITLEQWYRTWLFSYRIHDLKPRSFQRYEGIYRNYIKGSRFGSIKLKDLNTTHLQRFYTNLLEFDKKAPSTIHSINTRIKPALTEAERQGYINKNFAKLVYLPKVSKKSNVEILTKQEQDIFINAIKEHPLEMLFLMALSTGMRVGELLALKWSDIDFNNSIVTVERSLQTITLIDEDGNKSSSRLEQSTKTESSCRTIPIPKNILEKLKKHKLEQDKIISKSNGSYIDNEFIFTDSKGTPFDDKRPNRNIKSILKKLGFKPLKFHALRHCYASRLFEANVPPKTVQALMGHADISVTINIYTHVTEDTKYEAIEKLNEIF